MTKVQIAAQSLLTGLIVYATISLLRPLAELPYYGDAPDAPLAFLLMALCVGLLATTWLYVVAIGKRLKAQIASDDETLAPDVAWRLLAQSLRLTLVLVGLLLLPKTLPTIIAILKLPFVLRPIVNEVIVEGGFTAAHSASLAEWLGRLHRLLRMSLALYLLCGAPQFVRWRLARTERERGLCSKRSERPSDE